jgi:hypothetical protein
MLFTIAAAIAILGAAFSNAAFKNLNHFGIEIFSPAVLATGK